MRTMMRYSLALLMALGVSTPVAAQTDTGRVSFDALVGPSMANTGTTFSTVGAVDFKLSDRISFVGEGGIMPRAAFRDAAEIAPAAGFGDADQLRVNTYHWNGNVRVRPFTFADTTPYVTAGLGSFSADTVGRSRQVDGLWIEDRRRATDFATNLGAGLHYRVNDWLGVGADYRTFFVHRDKATPTVQRFTTGISLFLK
jgi:opacity protein-like surface antigen